MAKKDYEGDQLLFDEAKGEKKDTAKEDDKSSKKEESSDNSNKNKEDDAKMKETHTSKSNVHVDKHTDGHVVQIKINNLFYERLVYWIIIIVLIVLVFKNPFGGSLCFGGSTDAGATDQPAGVVDTSNTDTGTPDAEQESGTGGEEAEDSTDDGPEVTVWAVISGECQEVDALTYEGDAYVSEEECLADLDDEEDTAEEEEPEEEEEEEDDCDNGNIEVEIDDIQIDSDNEQRVDTVQVTIINNDNEDLEGFFLNLKWFNDDDESDYKNKPKLNKAGESVYGKREYSLIIPKCGGMQTYLFDDELNSHFMTTREIDNKFIIQVFDPDDDDDLLAEDTYTLDSS